MYLFKFRSTNRFDHLMDILLNERLYCAEYPELNDPFEGQFREVIPNAPWLSKVHLPVQTRPASIEDLPFPTEEVRVCSLSSDSADVRLWSLYADGHKGVAIEIDFTGIEDQATMVRYTNPLPKFGTSLLGGASAREVLSHKSEHWKFESEYRVISEKKYFDIHGRIKRVIFGTRTPKEISDLITKLRPGAIPCVHAFLDHESLKVQT